MYSPSLFKTLCAGVLALMISIPGLAGTASVAFGSKW